MKRCFPFFLVAALAFSLSLHAQNQPQPPQGFVALFNGKDFAGWHAMPHFDPRKLEAMTGEERNKQRAEWMAEFEQHWRVENAELINDGKGPYATSDREFGDFELLIDYKTVPRADSGIYLRANPQVQIWDSTEERQFRLGADKGSGGLWNNSKGAPGKDPLVLADRPFGEWNAFRILQAGARTTVYLNDKLVVDHATMENFWDRSKPLWPRGPIQLQTHGGEIRWRNIFVREIPAREANALLRAHGGDGFVSIFNGKNLEGWTGAVNSYEVRDGLLVCKPGAGGTLHTKEEYGDFVVRLEYRLPPGGNNGLAIRYSGAGEPAFTGMCEVQILDDPHPNYATLDPRQANGSAYGKVAAHRGFLRPTGEWNFKEVTVKGSTIKVELNGTIILDADLGKVTEFFQDQAHPGKDRVSGYFGLAAHNDPVEFRNIEIRKP